MSTQSQLNQMSLPTDRADIARRALEYMAARHCMSLATDGPEGLWAATVFYVNDGFELYFLSRSNTRHVRNIDASHRVAVTISDDVAQWLGIRGIQLEGNAERINEPHRRNEVLAAFERRYVFADSLWWPSVPQTDVDSEQGIYRIRPTRVLFVDHGFRDTRYEIPIEDALLVRGSG